MGLEEVVLSINQAQRIPLPEVYMHHPPGSLALAKVFWPPILNIKDNVLFFQASPKMETNIQFLLWWWGIVEEENVDWLLIYSNLYSTYIDVEVDLKNLENVEFILPNLFKSSKE